MVKGLEKIFLKNKIPWAFIAVLASVIILVFATYRNLSYVYNDNISINNKIDEQIHYENVLTSVMVLDSVQKDFNSSPSEEKLVPYYKSLSNIKRDTTQLHKVYPEKAPSQKVLLSQLFDLVRRKTENTVDVIENRRLNAFDSATVANQEIYSGILTDSVYILVKGLQKYNRGILKQVSQRRKTFSQNISYQFFILAFLFLMVLGLAYYFINRDFNRILKAEQQLKFNASLIRNISDAIITTDTENKITNWNIYAEGLYGYNETDVLGKDIDAVLKTEGEKNKAIADIRNVDSPADFWKGEQIHHHKSGRTIYTDLTISAIIDDEGIKTGTVSVARNITDRIYTEQKLQRLTIFLEEEVEAKVAELNTVFERITDAFIALDNQWNYTYVNKKAAELHNRSMESLIGKNIWEEFPDVANEPFYEALQTAKQTNQPQRLQLFYSRTGKWFEDLIYPSPDGISVYYHDITTRKTAELQIQQAHEKLSYHINNTPLGVVEFDMRINIKQWSHRATEIFGWTANEMKGMKNVIHRLIHPDDIALVQQALSNITEKQFYNGVLEIRNITKTGEVVHCEWYNSVLRDSLGNITGVMSMVHDITSRIMIQNELGEAEAKFRNLVEQSMVGVYIMQDAKFIYANPRLLELTGYTMEQMLDKSILDVVYVKDRPLLEANIMHRLQGDLKNMNHGLRCLNKNGELFYAEVFGSVTNYTGKPAIIGTLIDITDQVRSQQKLAQSEERYRTLIEQASDAIFISDREGNYLDVNSNGEKLSGYTKEELSKLNINDLMPKEGQPEENLINLEKMEDGSVVINERVMKRKDNRLIEVEISAKLLTDGRLLGIVRDISARKRSEEALKASEQKYRLLFDQNPMPMWMIAMPGREFLNVNKAAIEFYGYSKEEFLQMTAYDIRPGSSASLLFKYESEKETGVHNAGVWDHMKKDGSIVKVTIITHRIEYEGKAARLVLANDITEKIIAEEALKKSHEEFRELASHLEKVREMERTHIAREIHDELGQQLTGLKMDISWINRRLKTEDEAVLEKIHETIQLIDQTVKTVRRIATELRPSILDDLGLVAAMEWQSGEFEKRAEISSKFTSNVAVANVTPDIATGLFRIYQECLTNVLRHAGASEVVSNLDINGKELTLEIFDNGAGFIAEEIANKKTLGLLGMKERASLMGGTYEITSSPGTGTTIRILVPLLNNQHRNN